METNKHFTPELGETECIITDLKIVSMPSFLDKKNTIQLIETKRFKNYQKRLDPLRGVGDYLTFPELVSTVRSEPGIDGDISFRVEGHNELGKFLSIGTPGYMAEAGIVLLATSLTYPEQFKTRDYYPDPPEDKEEDAFYYPEVSLVLKLFARNSRGTTKGTVEWIRFMGYFPKDTYIPYKERLKFNGTWDECVDHYVVLVKKMMKLGKKELKASSVNLTRY